MTKAKTPKPKTTHKPMLQALQEMSCDGRLKSVAFRFLQDDLTKLRSTGDFRRAYHGLIVCQQLLGPLCPDYRQTLDAIRRALDSYAARADGWEESKETFQRSWETVLRILKQRVPPEFWSEVSTEISQIVKEWKPGKDAE